MSHRLIRKYGQILAWILMGVGLLGMPLYTYWKP